MKLFDSNIVIYAAKDEYALLRTSLLRPDACISAVTQVEVLGYHQLSENEKLFFESIFSTVLVLPINENIVDITVMLRQKRKYSLVDALMAATALFYDAELNTNNFADFDKTENLRLFNPLL